MMFHSNVGDDNDDV